MTSLSKEALLGISDSIDALSDEGHLGEVGAAFGRAVLNSLENTGIDFDSQSPELIIDMVVAHSELCVLIDHFSSLGSRNTRVH